MNRRTILTGLAVSPFASLPAVAAVPPEERIELAARELRDALFARYGDDKNAIAYRLGHLSAEITR